MALSSLASFCVVLFLGIGAATEEGRCSDNDCPAKVAGIEGSVLLQVARSAPEKPHLKYAPVKYLDGCPSMSPDFGPHPKVGALKGLGQHLQVAMEVSCTNFFLRCAYASGDFSFVAEAVASGLFADSGLRHDKELLQQGIASGASAIHQQGINSRMEQQDIPAFAKCNKLPDRSIQLASLRESIRKHFQAYEASPANLRDYPELAEGIALAFCDQIGDTGDSPCDDLMAKGIRSHYDPAVVSNVRS